jgi:formate dehydrogenase subunit gamma
MFRTISIWLLGITIVAMALHWLAFALRHRKADKGPRDIRRYNAWERLVHLAVTVSFLALVGTGFWPVIVSGTKMTGYLLMIHVTFGGVFAASLMVAAVTWAEDHRFAAGDGRWISRLGGHWTGRDGLPAGRFDASQKIIFWVTAALGVVVIVTPPLCMLKLFGTCGQEMLYEIHRYCSLALTIAVIKHAYLTSLAAGSAFRSMISGNVSSEWAKRYHPDWVHGTKDKKEE